MGLYRDLYRISRYFRLSDRRYRRRNRWYDTDNRHAELDARDRMAAEARRQINEKRWREGRPPFGT